MNSFRAVERAIAFEIERQAAALDAGEPLLQETRGWSEERGSTYRMRVKETSDDYRYFPEPDLPPLHLDPAWLAELRAGLPELPGARRRRYESEGLKAAVASTIVANLDLSVAFESTRKANPGIPPPVLGNWVTQEYAAASNSRVDRGPTGLVGASRAEEFAKIIELQSAGEISRSNAREVLETHIQTGLAAASIISERGFRQISDERSLAAAVEEVLAANPAAVADYRAGKVQAVGFLVGQVMKATRGQANAALAQAAVREQLEAREREEV